MNLRLASLSFAVLGGGIAALAAPAGVSAAEYQCGVSIPNGTTSVDNLGYSGNSKFDLRLSSNATVTGFSAMGTLTAYSPSWFCEAQINLTGGSGSASYAFQPYGVCSPGTTAFANAVSTGSIATGAGGRLHMEFFESFNDFGGGGVDGVYQDTQVLVTYTADSPGTCELTAPVTTTCASEGYKGAQLTWCMNICENGLTGPVLDTWIHRWINRYRDLPYCAQEGGGEEEPPEEGEGD